MRGSDFPVHLLPPSATRVVSQYRFSVLRVYWRKATVLDSTPNATGTTMERKHYYNDADGTSSAGSDVPADDSSDKF
ncbi:unnamed protein product [Allacma fusca]|uniref:Uncharacterized protein n=1 Tax=Allacma fusca TaxID=39272 RepID=A0A8J2KNJ1_9HEXA|nr:unnamed protein product [Allacma fusca]